MTPNDRIRDLCAYIEANADAAVTAITLADLSARAGLSPYHLQRTFKAVVGVSPKQYAENCRMRKFKAILREAHPNGVTGASVTGAIYDAGFGSASRVYEKADASLGMTPMEYRAGGRGVEITWAPAETPLGLMMVGASDRGLCFLQFGDDAEALLRALQSEYPNAKLIPMADPPWPEFDAWMTALNQYLSGHTQDLRLPLHVRATAFQLKVWKYLQSIPGGKVQGYAEVAKGIGQPAAVRAVARACASNHVAIAIPCHRVIRGTGELGGYKWGLERKRVLLDQERAAMARS